MKNETKTWKFDSKKEAVEFFVMALTARTPYPKTIELIQPYKVKVTKLKEVQ